MKSYVEAKKELNSIGYSWAHEVVALCEWFGKSKDEYARWRKEYDALGKERQKQINEAADKECKMIDDVADALEKGANAWFNDAVRSELDHLAGALRVKVAELVDDLAKKADVGLDKLLIQAMPEFDIHISPTKDDGVRCSLKLPDNMALALSSQQVRFVGWPPTAAEERLMAGKNPRALVRSGTLYLDYAVDDFKILGSSLADAAKSLVGGTKLRMAGKPRFGFTDEAMTFSLDAALSAYQPAMALVCRACNGLKKVEVRSGSNIRQENCRVCGGTGLVRRGPGFFLAETVPPDSSQSCLAVNTNLLNEIAYAIWEMGLFDLSIPAFLDHPIKNLVKGAAQTELTRLQSKKTTEPAKTDDSPPKTEPVNQAKLKVDQKVVEDLVNRAISEFSFTMQTTMPPLFSLAPGPQGQEVRLSWGDIVLDLSLQVATLNVKVLAQIAIDATARIALTSQKGKGPRLDVAIGKLGAYVTFLKPFLGIHPDYLASFIEFVLKQAAQFLMNQALSKDLPLLSLDALLVELESNGDDQRKKLVGQLRTALMTKDIAQGIDVKNLKVNPAETKGFYSVGFNVAPLGG
jgi:hypothetical protein